MSNRDKVVYRGEVEYLGRKWTETLYRGQDSPHSLLFKLVWMDVADRHALVYSVAFVYSASRLVNWKASGYSLKNSVYPLLELSRRKIQTLINDGCPPKAWLPTPPMFTTWPQDEAVSDDPVPDVVVDASARRPTVE